MVSRHGPSPQSVARLALRIPKGTWDTHMHVLDPRAFPLSKDATYEPQPHTLADAKAFLDPLGITKMVIVQPSIYGNDNSCTLDGLRQLGTTNGRAVIQFDPDVTTKGELREWHDLGVRGVRLNFKSVGAKLTADSLAASMNKYAEAIKDQGWVLELYIALEDIPLLEPVVPKLGGVKVCIDHFGHPTSESLTAAKTAHDLPGFPSLIKLLKQGQTWVKISASYRLFSDNPRHPVAESLCREIIKHRPDRCVFATDWPHTRFEGIDSIPFIEAMFDWIEAEQVPLAKVLVENAEDLFDGRY